MFFNSYSMDSETTKITEFPETIYILGINAASLFLAHKLQEGGHNVTIVDSPERLNTFLPDKELQIKEERLLQRKRTTINTTSQIKQIPSLLIIASEASYLQSNLTLLSFAKVNKVPALNLCMFCDNTLIGNFTHGPVLSGYLTSFCHWEKGQLNILSSSQIDLACGEQHPVFSQIQKCLEPTNISLSAVPETGKNYWNNLIPYSLASLLAEESGKNIYTFTKDGKGRQQIDNLLDELLKLAAADKTPVERVEILKRIYRIPPAFKFPLQNISKDKKMIEIKAISTSLLKHTVTSEIKIPALRQLLKSLYNKILA